MCKLVSKHDRPRFVDPYKKNTRRRTPRNTRRWTPTRRRKHEEVDPYLLNIKAMDPLGSSWLHFSNASALKSLAVSLPKKTLAIPPSDLPYLRAASGTKILPFSLKMC